MKLTITGAAAAAIRRYVNTSVRPVSGHGWTEVQTMRECRHGCKLHVRQRGCVREYALIHYSGYGCRLDKPGTRMVPVQVARAA